MPDPMELENFKAPASLRADLADCAARAGTNKSQVTRAAVKKFLASDPSRDEILELDGTQLHQLRDERVAEAARAALDGLK